jgi:hypothetical protein
VLALFGVSSTVDIVTQKDLLARLVTTPLISSFLGAAREGDLHDEDQGRRASAWAHWAIQNLGELRGREDRVYVALMLPGKFYDPRGSGISLPPHIELPNWALERSDVDFAARLGQLGNTALFEWWLVPEVTALRRSLFSPTGPGVATLIEQIAAHRAGLVGALHSLNQTVSSQWTVIERMQAAHPETLASALTEPFSSEEITRLFPPASRLGLELQFDQKLADSAGMWCSRRVGAWRLQLGDMGGTLGVSTPRLTTNSLFKDSLFSPERESASALLVRSVLLRRLAWRFLDVSVPEAVRPDRDENSYHLRAVVAQVGAKLPEASVESAVNFVQQYEQTSDAWEALSKWASGGHLITVTRDDFGKAFTRVRQNIRRAETPDRVDINQVLPLAWDSKSRVVRVTFSRRREQN